MGSCFSLGFRALPFLPATDNPSAFRGLGCLNEMLVAILGWADAATRLMAKINATHQFGMDETWMKPDLVGAGVS